jgi:hypothetical protein
MSEYYIWSPNKAVAFVRESNSLDVSFGRDVVTDDVFNLINPHFIVVGLLSVAYNSITVKSDLGESTCFFSEEGWEGQFLGNDVMARMTRYIPPESGLSYGPGVF